MGCGGGGESRSAEEEYRRFVKQRQKRLLGVDPDVLRRALQLYPKYKGEGFVKNFDMMRFRQFARAESLNCIEFIPAFQIISEIEESSKTDSGRKYLEGRYKPELISAVRKSLGIK